MTHINRTTNNIYMTTQIHECHPRDTEEQLYDVRLHDVELHDVANTCFAHSLGYILCTRDIVLEMTLYMTK